MQNVKDIRVTIHTEWLSELITLISEARKDLGKIPEINALIERHTGGAQVIRML